MSGSQFIKPEFRCAKCKCSRFDDLDDFEKHIESKRCRTYYEKYYRQMYVPVATDHDQCFTCDAYMPDNTHTRHGFSYICNECYDKLDLLYKSMFIEKQFNINDDYHRRPNIECIVCGIENPTFYKDWHEGLYLDGKEDLYICDKCFETLSCCKYGMHES